MHSFTAIALSSTCCPSLEQPVTALAGHPYLQHGAMLAIFNTQTSPVDILVNNVRTQQATSQVTAAQIVGLQRISGYSGGTDISATIVPHDSGNTFPQTISVVGNPGSVSGATLLKGGALLWPDQNITRTIPFAMPGWPGGSRGNNYLLAPSRFTQGYLSKGRDQGLILREGEGCTIAIIGSATILPPAAKFNMNILMNVGTHSYTLNTVFPFLGGTPLLAIFNNVGSGQVVTIWDVQMIETAGDNPITFTMERIEGIENGNPVTPIAHDSGASFPSTVLVRSSATTYAPGSREGALIVVPYLRRTCPPVFGTGVNGQMGILNFTACPPCGSMVSFGKNNPFMLRKGEGVGIFCRTDAYIGDFEIGVTFSVLNNRAFSFVA